MPERGKPAVKRVAVVFLLVLVAVSTFFLLAGGPGRWFGDESGEKKLLVLNGNVDIRQVDLAIDVRERIESVFVEEGDLVEKGQLLAQAEVAPFEAEVRRAEAALRAQQARLEKLLAGSRPQEVEAARADVAAAEARLRDAESTYERTRRLFERESVPSQELDNAAAARDEARARLKAAKERLSLAVEGPRKEDIEAARALLAQREAEVELARHNLFDAHLYAPATGIIRNRILEPGDMAAPEKPVLTLAVTEPLWLRVYLSEPDLGRVRTGMKAWITTDAFPDKRYEGWVGYISPAAEFTPKTVETSDLRTQLVYEARIFLRNPEGELRLGMPATAHVPLDQPPVPAPRGAREAAK